MIKQLLDTPSFKSTDFSTPQNLAYGGAAMPIQVIRRAIEAFPRTVGFVNAYGLDGPAARARAPDRLPRRLQARAAASRAPSTPMNHAVRSRPGRR